MPNKMEGEHLKVVMVPVSRLKRYARNARKHPPEQIQQLVKLISEFGWTNPILWAEKDEEIIAGHGRLEAAEILRLTRAPCIDLSHLTKKQRQAYCLADNALALQGEWDIDLLRHELDDLNFDGDFDMSLTGFTNDQLQEYMVINVEKPEGEGEGAAGKSDSVCQPGDVWTCGPHSLSVGYDAADCKDADKMIAAWCKYTNKDAIRDEDGVSFNDLKRVHNL